jgi:hypothetical protein
MQSDQSPRLDNRRGEGRGTGVDVKGHGDEQSRRNHDGEPIARRPNASVCRPKSLALPQHARG